MEKILVCTQNVSAFEFNVNGGVAVCVGVKFLTSSVRVRTRSCAYLSECLIRQVASKIACVCLCIYMVQVYIMYSLFYYVTCTFFFVVTMQYIVFNPIM